MSATVPKTDPWSRLNDLTSRVAALERVSQAYGASSTGEIGTTEPTSSTTYTDLAHVGPSVTVDIGPSGMARFTVNCYVGIPGGTGGVQSAGFVGIGIDGGDPTLFLDELIYFSNTVVGTTAVGMAGNQTASVIIGPVSQMPPGRHTFKMQYKMAGPGSVNFGIRTLEVEPL